MRWYPSLKRANGAIILEKWSHTPSLKSHKYAFLRVNGAIILKHGLVPPNTILLVPSLEKSLLTRKAGVALKLIKKFNEINEVNKVNEVHEVTEKVTTSVEYQ